MLRFKEYRETINEAGNPWVPSTGGKAEPAKATAKQPTIPWVPSAGTKAEPVGTSGIGELQAEIGKIVDEWMAELRRALFQAPTSSERRGLWDRFKGSLSNIWHGRYNQENPYFWKNRLGDTLGSKVESFDPNHLSLSDYKELKEFCDSLEEIINEDVPEGAENLKLNLILNQKAQELKKKLLKVVTGESPAPSPSGSSTTQVSPSPTPATSSAPAAQPNLQEPNTKPDKASVDAMMPFLKGLLKGKSINQREAEELEARLTSSKASIRRSAEDEIQKLQSKSQSTTTAPTTTGREILPADYRQGASPSEDQPTQELILTPPTTGRAWNELSVSEKEQWNRHGGGKATKQKGCLKENGIDFLPWIIRIGDPRRELLEKHAQGLLCGPKQGATRTNSNPIINNLINSGRWEGNGDNPKITSAQEFQKRLQKAQELHKQIKDDAARMSLTKIPSSKSPEESEPVNKETPPETTSPKESSTRRTAPRAGSEDEESTRDRKKEVLSKIDDLNDKESKKHYKQRLKQADTPEEINQIEKEVSMEKEGDQLIS